MPYPDKLPQVKNLIEQHRQLDQPLLLAIYYEQSKDPNSVFLLEVISGFGYDEVSEDKELFEITYGSTDGFPLPHGSRLNIVLTNPTELQVAAEQDWVSIRPVRSAIEAGTEHYQVIYDSGIGSEMLGLLRKSLVAA